MKKSQIYSHVFIYILTIILVSIILIYGYNTIKNFRQVGERICLLKFENELRNIVEAMSSDFESIKRKDIQLCGYTQACFVDFHLLASPSPSLSLTLDPIIRDSIKSKTGKNTFIVRDIAEESFYVGNISVEPDVLCIKPINDKISLRLEGKGSHVLLREWK